MIYNMEILLDKLLENNDKKLEIISIFKKFINNPNTLNLNFECDETINQILSNWNNYKNILENNKFVDNFIIPIYISLTIPNYEEALLMFKISLYWLNSIINTKSLKKIKKSNNND